jgi:hypothetical protein
VDALYVLQGQAGKVSSCNTKEAAGRSSSFALAYAAVTLVTI